MFKLMSSAEFRAWQESVKDVRIRAAMVRRLLGLELGRFGDCKSIGGGIFELRLHMGSGLRLYFTRASGQTIVLLTGGDKGSQTRDIEKARRIKNRELGNASGTP